MSLFICQFCGSERKNANAKSIHEVYCKENHNRKVAKGSPGKRKNSPQEIRSVTTREKCSYGCGQTAKYKTTTGKFICDVSHNKCPENRRKNSKGGIDAYSSGKRVSPVEQYENLPEKTKEKMAWKKGLRKDDDERIRRMAISLSRNTKGRVGRKHDEETKKKLSEKRIEFLEKNNKHCDWYEVKGVKVQGKLEKRLAEFLDKNDIYFERNKLRFLDYRVYTPDFYIPKFNLYIEVKGFLYEKDKEKMRLVLLENNVDIRLAFSEDIDCLYDETDLLNLREVSSFIDHIDYSKFENKWVVEGNWYTSLA